MTTHPDLLIVGGGPAGVSAAVEATARGLSVLLLDENPASGGRIWQALEARGASDQDDEAALALLQQFRACGAQARFRATVWAIEPDGQVFWSAGGTAHASTPARILLATGTTERPMPIPGWTLPGVMTVGAAQIALKTGGLVPHGATWIAGQGPLLLLYAVQALRAGGDIAGIIDLSNPAKNWPALRHLPAALPAAADLAKGIMWRRAVAKAGVPWLRADAIRAEGDTALERIVLTAHGQQREEHADTLLLHDGVIPSVQLTRALGCAHAWSEAQRCWHPVADAWGTTSIPHIHVAGDGAGIAGAWAATLSGRLAALGVAHALGRIDTATRDAAAAPLRARRQRHLAMRPLLDTLYAARAPHLADDTMVCRCEEVTAGDIRQAVRFGCLGMNQLKAYTRCGMGPCQGRTCATIAAEVIAEARGLPVPDIEPLRTRFPIKPLRLAELVDFAEE
ncbi:MAG: NAD(P)/FAD-dependent oxidoreductase [Acetobacteraceae bacterium]|nr:NAD(P)/FAD-dependent oxidoreductase [Acetobacteraceae bacterium]